MPDLKTALAPVREQLLKKTVDEWVPTIVPPNQLKPEGANNVTQSTNHANIVKPEKGPAYFAETTGSSRATFNYVKEHPDCTKREVCEALQNEGHKYSTIDTLLGHNIMVRYMSCIDGKLRVTIPEYRSVKASDLRLAREHRLKSKGTVTKTAAKAVPAAKPTATVEPLAEKKARLMPTPAAGPALDTQAKVQRIMDSLTVSEAKLLIEELKKMFGG